MEPHVQKTIDDLQEKLNAKGLKFNELMQELNDLTGRRSELEEQLNRLSDEIERTANAITALSEPSLHNVFEEG